MSQTLGWFYLGDPLWSPPRTTPAKRAGSLFLFGCASRATRNPT